MDILRKVFPLAVGICAIQLKLMPSGKPGPADLTELVDQLDQWHLSGHRTFQIIDRFDAYRLANPETPWNAERALATATVETMRVDPHSIAAGLFQHRSQAQFGFTRCEQQLLEVALEGMEDAAASKSLFVGVPAIKRRWANIFERVTAIRPDLCPPDGDGTRGVQKRPRVLTYIRHHPEELRPFDFSSMRTKRSEDRLLQTSHAQQ
jgi:hypothetical protein